MNVAELAVERRDRRGGQQIGRDHPGEILDIAEIAADGRQRSRHDRLIERAEQHRQQNTEHDGADGGVIERRVRGCDEAGIHLEERIGQDSSSKALVPAKAIFG